MPTAKKEMDMGAEKKTEHRRHVGIILDGNRRWARRFKLKPWEGHEKGFEKLKQLFTWCRELDIREMTLYCFSMQNFNRSKTEIKFLMEIFKRAARDARENPDVHEHKIRINAIGRWHLFPDDVVLELERTMEATESYDKYTINLALAYGGREEIVDAARSIARAVQHGELEIQDIDTDTLDEHVYLASQPDFIIRTGGDHRTSNFLMWQSSYSEWFFLEKTWPEFEREDLARCIDEFMGRERRFGG